MMTVDKIPETQQAQQLQTQFLSLLTRKNDLVRELADVEAKALALQNILAGVELGKRVAAEAEAAKAEKQVDPPLKVPN